MDNRKVFTSQSNPPAQETKSKGAGGGSLYNNHHAFLAPAGTSNSKFYDEQEKVKAGLSNKSIEPSCNVM